MLTLRRGRGAARRPGRGRPDRRPGVRHARRRHRERTCSTAAGGRTCSRYAGRADGVVVDLARGDRRRAGRGGPDRRLRAGARAARAPTCSSAPAPAPTRRCAGSGGDDDADRARRGRGPARRRRRRRPARRARRRRRPGRRARRRRARRRRGADHLVAARRRRRRGRRAGRRPRRGPRAATPAAPDVFRGGDGRRRVSGGGGRPRRRRAGRRRRLRRRACSAGPGDDRLAGPRDRRRGAAGLRLRPGARHRCCRPADRVVLPAGCERVDPCFFGDTVAAGAAAWCAGGSCASRMPQSVPVRVRRRRCRVKGDAVRRRPARSGTREARWRRDSRPRRCCVALPRRRAARRGRPALRLVKYETDERPSAAATPCAAVAARRPRRSRARSARVTCSNVTTPAQPPLGVDRHQRAEPAQRLGGEQRLERRVGRDLALGGAGRGDVADRHRPALVRARRARPRARWARPA